MLPPDVILKSRDGRPMATVAVKGHRPPLDPQVYAGQVREQMDWYRVPLGLLLTTTQLFVWERPDRPGSPDWTGEPVLHEYDVTDLLAPFFRRVRIRPEVIVPEAFDMLADTVFNALCEPDPTWQGESGEAAVAFRERAPWLHRLTNARADFEAAA